MPLDVRLVNMTPDPIEIDDGLGGKLVLPPGQAVNFPGEIAGPDLRKLLRDGLVMIEDEPPINGYSD
jgi:hypothetical protein